MKVLIVEAIHGQVAYVQVEESFKGGQVGELVFRSYGTSCDPVYKEGQRWLFYAEVYDLPAGVNMKSIRRSKN
jgi:hypothetical protein